MMNVVWTTHVDRLLHAPWVRWLMTVGWIVVITVFLLQSSGDPNSASTSPPPDPDLMRRLTLSGGHIIGFGGLTLFLAWALMRHISLRYAIGVAVVFSIGYGMFTEWLQIPLPDRTASWWDVAFNTGATLLVAATLWRSQRMDWKTA